MKFPKKEFKMKEDSKETYKEEHKEEHKEVSKKQSYSSSPVDTNVAACVSELMNATTSFHKLHLKVSGEGSYAAHKALQELYDALPDLADTLAEGYQGAICNLLKYQEPSPRILETTDDAISYLKDMKEMVTKLQESIPYSEIVNDLDNVKSTINSGIYKLKFLS
jgi:DNA-binding ferritin-like protein